MNEEELIAFIIEAEGLEDYEAAEAALDQLDFLQRKAEVSKGQTLNVAGLDTGVELPQWAFEGLAGMGRRMSQIGTLGMHETPEAAAEFLDESTPATVGGAVADIGAMAAGGTLLKGLSAAPKVGNYLYRAGTALSAPKTAAQGAASMGAYGALTNEDRLAGGLGGLLGGAAGVAVPKAIGRVVKPSFQKGAQLLKSKGVDMTPGELLGGSVQRIEDSLTSIPLLGDSIRNAKVRSMHGFNRAAIDDALSIVGKKLDDNVPMGREAIAQADDMISSMYDDILKDMPVKMDYPLRSSLDSLRANVSLLDDKGNKARLFNEEILNPIEKYTKNPTKTMLGRTFKEITRTIRDKYKKWGNTDDMIQGKIADAAREAQKALLEAAKRQNPKAAKKLIDTDAAYAAMSRVREASESLGAPEGVFTPAQLLNRVKAGAKGTKAFGKGRAYGQELADAGKAVLPAKVPDSGTFGRSAVGLGLGAALYGGGEAGMVPGGVPLGAALMGGSALYTPPGQKVLRGLLSRPASAALVRESLERAAPYAGLLGGATAMQVAQ